MITAALVVSLTLLGLLTILQILLIAGAPLGAFAWGGAHQVLPRKQRIAAFIAIGLYGTFAALLMSRAGVLPGEKGTAIVVATWILFAYVTFSIAVNAMSHSRSERLVQTPVSVVLATGILVVALH